MFITQKQEMSGNMKGMCCQDESLRETQTGSFTTGVFCLVLQKIANMTLKKTIHKQKTKHTSFGSSLGTWLPGANTAQSECLGEVPRRVRQSRTSETRSAMHSSVATLPRAKPWCPEQCCCVCLSACCTWQTANCLDQRAL